MKITVCLLFYLTKALIWNSANRGSMYSRLSKFEALVRSCKPISEFSHPIFLVPLYWLQSGYGLKPPPALDPERTSEQNLRALESHLGISIRRYGPLVSDLNVVVSLAHVRLVDYCKSSRAAW